MTQKTLSMALGLALGAFALGSVQANEQGLRPLPEDLAAQSDERTEETQPFPEDSLQGAEAPVDDSMQDAVAAEDEETIPMEDESDSETASTDVSPADEAAAADATAAESTVDTVDGSMESPAADTANATADTRNIAPGSLSSPDALQQALDTRFQSGDENGDGMLSEREIADLDDDDLVFATIDSDGDGSVTSQEWNSQLQTQVASADNDSE